MTSTTEGGHAAVKTSVSARKDGIHFCSRCGVILRPRELHSDRPGTERVCAGCGMGVLLTCSRSALPRAGAAFLIVTASLRVSAVSEAGERIFGLEDEILGATLLSLLSSPAGDDELAMRVVRAATGAREITTMPVVAAASRARRLGELQAQIAGCGPPRAALVVATPAYLKT